MKAYQRYPRRLRGRLELAGAGGTVVLLALGVACSNATDGATQGSSVAGASGVDGRDGVDGHNGEDGSPGKDGSNGVDGREGVDGEDGSPGKDGSDGQTAIDGEPGIDGVNGLDGANGIDAPIPGPVAIWGEVPEKTTVTTNAAVFTFACTAGDCAFEYNIDDAVYQTTETRLALSGLVAGSHTLKLRAKALDAETDDWGETTSYTWTSRKPNILTILADDLGFSDLGTFGSEIDTPHLDELARNGRILVNNQVGTVCAVTRAMLISGTDHHLVGEGTMGAPTDERAGLPGYEGYLNESSLSIADLLKDAGYRTYISGKWHLGSRIVGETSGAGKTPDQWGFDRSFSLLGGAVQNHFLHLSANSTTLTLDGVYFRPGVAAQPQEGDFSADFFTDKLIEFIDDGLTTDPDKPFFAYAAYLSPHWPLQAPEPWLNKYAGKYDAGYSAIAAERLRRLKDRGVFPQSLTPSAGFTEAPTGTPATANNGTASALYQSAVYSPGDGYVDHGAGPVIKNWESLNDAEKKAQARYMEIYAAMVDHLDYSVGRLIQHLKDIGEYEYTFISFSSDSGAEAWPNSGNPQSYDEQSASAAIFPTLGRDSGTGSARNTKYGIRWAEVSNTPVPQAKGFQGTGGLGAPLIVHLPGQRSALPPVHHFTHVTDLTATLLDVAQAERPAQAAPSLVDEGVDKNAGKVIYKERAVHPVTGISFLDLLRTSQPERLHTEAFGGETYGRAFILSADGRYRARWTEPPYGPVDGHWELFDIVSDFGETRDISAEYPTLVESLVQKWKEYLVSVGGVEPLRPRGFY